MVYDVARHAGWAVYTPGRASPRFGVLRLPATRTDGSNGPAFKLLFEHISWADRNFGRLAHIGYELFLAPTGGKKDDQTSFQTSPKTIKTQVGMIATIEMCAEMLGIESHPIHNASWRSHWLGAQKRGTKREQFKALAIAKAKALGWAPHDDNDADAIGQLHFLLKKLGITPPWNTEISRDQLRLALEGVAMT